MKVKSILMPPNGAEKLPSRLDPPENGTLKKYLLSVLFRFASNGD